MTISTRIRNQRFAIWDTPETGDKMAPFDDPASHLARIWCHSEFDYYVVALGPTNVTLMHAAVAGGTYPVPGSTTTMIVGQGVTTDLLLLNHNLGYVPRYMIVYGTSRLSAGRNVQPLGNRGRLISHYATATQIRIKDFGCSSDVALPSVSRTYGVLVFKPAVADPLLPVFSARQGILAQGKIRKTQKHLRRAAAGDSPYDLPLGRNLDIKSGGKRWVLPDGTVISTTNYDGTFAGPANIQAAVQ